VDFGVICALLLLNATVGFIQEYQAGSIVEELKKSLALKAIVVRDGRVTDIDATEVVPGDVLKIDEVLSISWAVEDGESLLLAGHDRFRRRPC
jgi:H+-transporting ATPase